MSNDAQTSRKDGTRFITKKTGTYLIWYDAVAGRQRRVNLTKLGTRQYFGTGNQR